jgi:hypothetical protein
MKYIQGQNRTQTYRFPVTLDDAISSDNEVRLIDVFADNQALESYGFQLHHDKKEHKKSKCRCRVDDDSL